MTSPAALREKAERFRRIALTIADLRTIEALNELAVAYEAEALHLEAEQESDLSAIEASQPGG